MGDKASRVRTQKATVLETRHPTDHNWWGVLHFEPAGQTRVHVYASGAGSKGASLPFVELDELQEMIDKAREACARAGFVE